MLETIILIAGSAEQPIFSQLLLEHNPCLGIISILSSAELFDLDPELFQRARLIAFATSIIIPQFILARLGFGAYNFHPGPPEYPGWAPAHFALYDQAAEFGVTAHVMVERVDEGAIVQVDRFGIPAGSNIASLDGLTYAHLAKLFWKLSKPLAMRPEPLPELSVSWAQHKNTRKRYAAMCDIPLDISKQDLHRRMEVFGANHFGISPKIMLHGIEFYAVEPLTSESVSCANAEP